MASSKASTMEEYLNELPPDRREVVSKVRDVILKYLPPEVVGKIAGAQTVDESIQVCERSRKK